MSTTDHKRAFRAPTDNDGGFYVHPNSLDDITLSNGTPGLQRIVATNQASAIGPYIVRGLDVTGNTSTFTVNAGEAVFKSGGVVSVVAATNTSIGGAGNYLYLSNAGTITRETTPVKSDTKLLIDYVVGSAWVCTKQVDGKTTLGHKDVEIVDGILSVVDSRGTGDTTIDTTTGITTSAITATTGTIATLTSTSITTNTLVANATSTFSGRMSAVGGIGNLPAPDTDTSPLRRNGRVYGYFCCEVGSRAAQSTSGYTGFYRIVNSNGQFVQANPGNGTSYNFSGMIPLDFKPIAEGGDIIDWGGGASYTWHLWDPWTGGQHPPVAESLTATCSFATLLANAKALPGAMFYTTAYVATPGDEVVLIPAVRYLKQS